MRRPALLAPGARVALIAPSGPMARSDDVSRAEANAASFGWEVQCGEHLAEREGYLAGSDAARLADLQRAVSDDSVDAIWCIRGGYGAMRLLDALDLSPLRSRPKALIGYSDITALHAAVGRAAGLVGFHGPTARARLTPFSRDSLERAVVQGTDPCGVAEGARTLVPGRARGPLVGGNLALLASLVGTRFAPSYEGAILVLEDVTEYVYRLDRMLVQLQLSGALDRIAGLVFGSFTDIPKDDSVGVDGLEQLLERTARTLRVPCFTGAPVGHIADQWTLPLGAIGELDADACRLTVTDD